jgi:hypothetical protein
MVQERSFQVFISHSPRDASRAEQLATVLRNTYGLEVWLHAWSVVPGDLTQEQVEEGLRQSNACAVLIGQTGVQDWQQLHVYGAIEARTENRERSFRVIPVFLPGCPTEVKNSLPSVLRLFEPVEFSVLDDSEAMNRLVAGIKGILPSSIATIEVPFVIFAMTREEANELVSGAVFSDPRVKPIARQHFTELTATLERSGLTEIVNHYGSTRDQWRPQITYPATIRDTVVEIVGLVNKLRQAENPGESMIFPRFYSEEFLSDNESGRLDMHDWLRQTGFILIVDAISMFHPLLRDEKLKPDEVGGNDLVSIVIVSPPVGDTLLSDMYLFSIEPGPVSQLVNALDKGQLSDALHDQFRAHNLTLTLQGQVTVDLPGSKWTIADAGKKYSMRRQNDMLHVCSHIRLPEWEIADHIWGQAYHRYDNRLDIRCEFGIGNRRLLRRWLASVVPQAAIIVKGDKANPVLREIARSRLGIVKTGERPFPKIGGSGT